MASKLALLLLAAVAQAMAFQMVLYSRVNYEGPSETFSEPGRHSVEKWEPGSYSWRTGDPNCCVKTCLDQNRVDGHCSNRNVDSVTRSERFNWVLLWCGPIEPSCSHNPGPEGIEPLPAPVPVELDGEAGHGPESQIEIEDSSIIEAQINEPDQRKKVFKFV